MQIEGMREPELREELDMHSPAIDIVFLYLWRKVIRVL